MSANTIPNGATTSAWWLRRWTKFLRQIGAEAGPAALRGLRVKRLEVQPGVIQAQVVERDNGATQVEVHFPTLTDEQWDAIIDELGSQAIFVAQLLAGDMPAEIEQVFTNAGSWLLPTSADVLEQRCASAGETLEIAQTPCRSLNAVYAQLGEMVAEDPWLLLRLRGRDRQQVLATLQEKRNSEAQDLAVRSAPAANGTAIQEQRAFYAPPFHNADANSETVAGLEARIADFWGRRKDLEDVHHHLVRPAVELALLRRLGPLSANRDDTEAYRQLQEVYHRVTMRAWDTAFSPDEESCGEEKETADQT
jgi:uncharacterized Zn finger protein